MEFNRARPYSWSRRASYEGFPRRCSFEISIIGDPKESNIDLVKKIPTTESPVLEKLFVEFLWDF